MEVIMSGMITAILPAEQGVSQRTGQPWMSQEYVLCHEQGQYPKNVCFRIFGQEKIQQAAIQPGEQVTVHLNIDAKPSQKNGKFFNSIDCWKVERQQAVGYQQQPQQPVPQTGMPPQAPQAGSAQAPFPPSPTTAQPPYQGAQPYASAPPPQQAPYGQSQKPQGNADDLPF